jgi:hypothetical protein
MRQAWAWCFNLVLGLSLKILGWGRLEKLHIEP